MSGKAGADSSDQVWMPRTFADLPDALDVSYPKPDEVEAIRDEICEGDPSGIRVMIETQRVLESGAPSFEQAEDRAVRLYARLDDLRLNQAERQNLGAILGPRFHAHHGYLKLTSTKYPSPDDNTRHCIEMLRQLIQASKQMTEQLQQHQQQQPAPSS